MLLAWQKKGYIFWPQNTADKLQQPGSGWLSFIKNEVAKSCWMNKKANSSLTLNKKIYLRFKKCQRHRISKNLSLHHIVFLTNVLEWFDTVG